MSLETTFKRVNASAFAKVSKGVLELGIPRDARVDIMPNATAVIDTGVVVNIPEGHVGLMEVRYKLSKHFSLVGNSTVIHHGFDETVHIHLTNLGPHLFEVPKEMGVIQIVVVPVNTAISEV